MLLFYGIFPFSDEKKLFLTFWTSVGKEKFRSQKVKIFPDERYSTKFFEVGNSHSHYQFPDLEKKHLQMNVN